MKFNRWSLWLQLCVDYFFLIFSYFLIWAIGFFYFRLRLKDGKLLRQQFKEILNNLDAPLIICPNHLTYIDSAIIQYALASPWTYLIRPSCWAWNLPKKANVEKSLFFQLMCYLGKCILLPSYTESDAIKIALEKIEYLLKKGQCIMLFPEGTRSESGRVNDRDFGYGVGDLLQLVPQAKVLCIYMRGEHQVAKSKFPVEGTITLSLKLLAPVSAENGLRGSRDLSRQVIKTLVEMEQEYFAARP